MYIKKLQSSAVGHISMYHMYSNQGGGGEDYSPLITGGPGFKKLFSPLEMVVGSGEHDIYDE